MENKENKISFCEKMFGKRFRDLTQEEKKEFLRVQKRLSRTGVTTRKSRDWSNLSPEEAKDAIKQYHRDYCREYYRTHIAQRRATNKKYRDVHRGAQPFSWTLSMKLFGKQRAELTEEERKFYNNTRAKILREKKKEQK